MLSVLVGLVVATKLPVSGNEEKRVPLDLEDLPCPTYEQRQENFKKMNYRAKYCYRNTRNVVRYLSHFHSTEISEIYGIIMNGTCTSTDGKREVPGSLLRTKFSANQEFKLWTYHVVAIFKETEGIS